MLDRIKAILSGGRDEGSRTSSERDALQVAAAALLVEAASLDGNFDADERETIETLLAGQFGLAAEEAKELVDLACDKVDGAAELYGFTRAVKDGYDHEDRVRLIEMLWEVAYADGHLHDYEANLVRRVAGLLYVPDRESGLARKRVLDRLGIASSP